MKDKVKNRMPRLQGRTLQFIKNLYRAARVKVDRSIRLKLILTFAFCIVIAFLVAAVAGSALSPPAVTRTGLDQTDVDNDALRMIGDLELNRIDITPIYQPSQAAPDKVPETGMTQNTQPKTLEEMLQGQRYMAYPQERGYILAEDGTVLIRTANADKTKLDIHQILKEQAKEEFPNVRVVNEEPGRYTPSNYRRSEYVVYRRLLPFQKEDFKGWVYVYAETVPPVYQYNNGTAQLFAFVFGLAAFLFLFFYLTGRRLKYLEEISDGLKQIAGGEFSYLISKKGNDELGILADNINSMSRQIREGIEAERHAERTKNELITNVSHDLRTPLTSIIGYLGLLNEGKYNDEEQAKTFVSIANRKALRLKTLIDALFEYTKLNCRDMTAEFEEVDLSELIAQLIEENNVLFEQSGVAVKLTVPNHKMLINAHGDKLVRVFDNLLTNAVKYGREGKLVRVVVTDEGNWVSVRVVNYGERIPEQDIPFIFERFYRVEKSRSEDTGGTGLGLAISKQIVDLHGGTISVTSDEEETVFTVRLKKFFPS